MRLKLQISEKTGWFGAEDRCGYPSKSSLKRGLCSALSVRLPFLLQGVHLWVGSAALIIRGMEMGLEISVLGNALGVIQKREGKAWRLQGERQTCSRRWGDSYGEQSWSLVGAVMCFVSSEICICIWVKEFQGQPQGHKLHYLRSLFLTCFS